MRAMHYKRASQAVNIVFRKSSYALRCSSLPNQGQGSPWHLIWYDAVTRTASLVLLMYLMPVQRKCVKCSVSCSLLLTNAKQWMCD